MASDVSTLILRFRDLSTQSGDTLRLHSQIIAEQARGYVWWGWWNKSGEVIPDEIFRAFQKKIQSKRSVPFYLLDSGNKMLYEARCVEIEWDKTHQRVPSPEPEATPAYYRNSSYLAWFKFSEIRTTPIVEEKLQQLAYVRVDEFFEGGESHYAPFYDKRVHSIQELLQQNRTIWFLRESKPGDPTHEISLLDSHRLTPEDFPKEYRQSGHRNLLWVSDLHYSIDGHHSFPATPTPDKKPVWSAIEQSLQEHKVGDLAGVVVSGDLTWRADPGEFSESHAFFDWLRSRRLNNYDVVLCPGNHDLKFSEDSSNKGNPVSVALASARKAYEHFYQDLFFKKPNRFLSCGRRFLLGGAVPVEIAALNTSLLSQEKGFFQGHGFLGDEQLEDAAKQMGWESEAAGPRACRIVVVHHHVIPVTFREEPKSGALYSVVLDAEALSRWLVKHRVDLVLHGHMHQSFCAQVARPVDLRRPDGRWHQFWVVGLGSTGVKGHLGEDGKNLYGTLSFNSSSIEVKLYTIDPINPSQIHWSVTIPYRHLEGG